MIPKQNKMPNIYDEKTVKKRKFNINVPHLMGIVLVLLVVTRFVNLGMVWIFSKAETSGAEGIRGIKYIHRFLSSESDARQMCKEEAEAFRHPGKELDTVVVSYTDLIHPIVFVVHSKKKFNTVDLGPVIATIGPGYHTFTFSLSGAFQRTHGNKKEKSYLDHSVLFRFLRPKSTASGVSYMVKPGKKSGYVHIPYIVYFFLPLVVLLILSEAFSKAVLTGFFYYTGLFLLFDTSKLLSIVPIDSVLKAIGLTSPGFIHIFGIVMFQLIFLALAVLGLFNWKNRRDAFKENLLVVYFIFLPLALRF